MTNLPEYLSPELARACRPLGAPLRAFIMARRGIAAVWLDIAALNDANALDDAAVKPRALLAVALVDAGFEGSESIEHAGGSVTVAMLTRTVLEEALETDEELATVVATGYRLCGADPEVFELEALARQIATGA